MSFLDQLLPKNKNDNYFVVLGIEKHHCIAIVAYVDGNNVEVKGFGESEYGKESMEIEAIDIALSTAEKDIPEDILVERTIFAVNANFIENDTIKPQYKDKLEQITKELDLKPRGFIEYGEAISYYLEKQDGSPVSTLLLAIEKHQLIFSFIQTGKVRQSVVHTRTDSFGADFEYLLTQIHTEIFPSHIILYDHQENLESIKETLLGFGWHKHTAFLHTPRIEILTPSQLFIALVQAASSSFLKQFILNERVLESPMQIISETVEHNRQPQKEEVHEIPPDIKPNKMDNLSIPHESFGFVKGTKEQHIPQNPKTIPVTEPVQDKPDEKMFRPSATFLKLPHFSLPKVPEGIYYLIIPILFFILFGAFVFYSIFVSYKANVSLLVYPLVSTQQIDIVLSSKTIDSAGTKNIIPILLQAEQVDGTKSAATTGKVSIGEKAKGEVTIYNKTLAQKTFPKSTVILSNNLPFSLDTEVSIASASDTGEGLSFGKNTMKVTAMTIGPEGNITANNSFTFKDFPENSFIAKNAQPFSGGTSREVPSVSKTDEDGLVSMLTQELTSQAKAQISSKLAPGMKILDSLIKSEIISKKLTPAVGSEAKETTLVLTIKVSAYAYTETDLQALSQKLLISPPTGFSAQQDQTSVTIDDAKLDKNGTYLAKGKIHAYFLPQLDLAQIQKSLPGKSFDAMSSELSSTPYLSGIRVFQQNPVPFMKNKLPFKKENITVKIVPSIL
jgi:hypothetical protein